MPDSIVLLTELLADVFAWVGRRAGGELSTCLVSEIWSLQR